MLAKSNKPGLDFSDDSFLIFDRGIIPRLKKSLDVEDYDLSTE